MKISANKRVAARCARCEQPTPRGEWGGPEEIDDGVWSLYYEPLLLARFDEREKKFYG